MTIRCDSCGGKLKKPGALIFSPPKKNRKVRKYHICRYCWFMYFENEW